MVDSVSQVAQRLKQNLKSMIATPSSIYRRRGFYYDRDKKLSLNVGKKLAKYRKSSHSGIFYRCFRRYFYTRAVLIQKYPYVVEPIFDANDVVDMSGAWTDEAEIRWIRGSMASRYR